MKRISLVLVGIVVSVILVGCRTEMTRLDADFGTSYELAKASQVLNPDAEKNLEPVTGLAGDVSKRVTDKYARGFEEPAKAPTYVFQLGTGQ